MSDLISRQAAIKAVESLPNCYNGYSDTYDKSCIIGLLEELPSAQPERKTGKWIFVRDEEAGNALYMCSECGKGDIHAPEVKVSYCWNCGAQMEEEA